MQIEASARKVRRRAWIRCSGTELGIYLAQDKVPGSKAVPLLRDASVGRALVLWPVGDWRMQRRAYCLRVAGLVVSFWIAGASQSLEPVMHFGTERRQIDGPSASQRR
jgi:hypothetical protein